MLSLFCHWTWSNMISSSAAWFSFFCTTPFLWRSYTVSSIASELPSINYYLCKILHIPYLSCSCSFWGMWWSQPSRFLQFSCCTALMLAKRHRCYWLENFAWWVSLQLVMIQISTFFAKNCYGHECLDFMVK